MLFTVEFRRACLVTVFPFLAAAGAAPLAGCSDGGVPEASSGSASGAGAGGSDSASGSGGAGGEGAGGAMEAACPSPWDAAPPTEMYGPKLAWNHDEPSGSPFHRGRDLMLNPGDPQWVLGKFAYNISDNDLEDEQVDIYLLRDCSDTWELLGSAFSTDDNFFGQGPHPSVEGVDDDGGRVYFEIPAAKKLGLGRHRIHFVVRGDLTATDQRIEVVPAGTPFFVSDIDGTLTSTETAEFGALLSGVLPEVHEDSAAAFKILVEKGYHPVYLTARPEILMPRTRELLDKEGFPRGIVHTTLTTTGATGEAAMKYKTGELATIKSRGITPLFAFGNTDSDAAAYENTSVLPLNSRIFYQFDDMHGGRRIESYTDLINEFGALSKVGP